MKYPSFFLGILALFTVTASAESVVSIAVFPSTRHLVDSWGNTLADGSLVLVGSFSNYADVAALPVSELEQVAGWTLFGSTAVTSIFDNGGKLSGDVVNDAPDASSFSGKQIFLWVFNAPTIRASTEYGIYTTWDGNPLWLFPAGGPESQATIDLDDTKLVALLGSVEGDLMRLTGIVPEPSAYAVLFGFAALAVACGRRRCGAL